MKHTVDPILISVLRRAIQHRRECVVAGSKALRIIYRDGLFPGAIVLPGEKAFLLVFQLERITGRGIRNPPIVGEVFLVSVRNLSGRRR